VVATRDIGVAATCRDGTKARIGVPVDGLTTWAEHRREGGAEKDVADALEETARMQASDPQMWLLSYEPVPRERWARVERWTGWPWALVLTR
jgi:hypothetical protein